MEASATSTQFAEGQPTIKAPRLPHLFGFGLYLYGDRDYDQTSGSFVRTLCFCLFYMPLIPIRAYRVAPSYEGWNYLARIPLKGPAKVYRIFAAISVPVAVAAFVGNLYWNSPANVTRRALAEAERLESEGRLGEAAVILASIATGPTDQYRWAADRLAKILDAPVGKLDNKSRAAAFRAAATVQKTGRLPRPGPLLHEKGVALARDCAATDPAGALEILESIAALAPAGEAVATLRHDLMEKLIAADPSNLDLAVKLASDYELRGQFDRAEKLLRPLRDRLGDGEGAKILGICDSRANRFEQAIPLLRAYTKPRLERLSGLEEKIESVFKAEQERIIRQLENRRDMGFDYDGYRFASESRKQQMLQEYVTNKIKAVPEIARLQQTYTSEAEVIPVALELGMALLQQAQTQTDPSTRKSLLDQAEATFLSVSRMASDRADYQFSLAQVYYWQGKQEQGREAFNRVLADTKRDPNALLQVAMLYRDLGSQTEARPLAEEAYNKAPAGALKERCAVIRGLLGVDIEDRITWFRRSNVNEPSVKAMLSEALAEQAMIKGNEQQAIQNFREAVAVYDSLPESISTLNNGSLALMKLASLTGDLAAYTRAGSMMEKAAALDPGNSLTTSNAARMLVETGLREVIGTSIDLTLLKVEASLNEIGFLINDESGRQEYAARIRSQPSTNRALSLMDKVMLLAPKNPESYRAPVQFLAYRNDVDRLRAILKRLESTQLDLGDEINEMRKNESGINDVKRREATGSLLTRLESDLPLARAKGGPTFAAAVGMIVPTRIAVANLGGQVDREATVALAEEAFAKSPSLSSRWTLIEALLFRGFERVAASEPGLARIRDRFIRTMPIEELIAWVVTSNGPLKGPTLKDPDIVRAIDLVRETFEKSPSFALGPRSWAMVQATYPDLAKTMSSRYFETEVDHLEDEISIKLRPFESMQVIKASRIALMKGNASEASKILQEAISRGIPIPPESP